MAPSFNEEGTVNGSGTAIKEVGSNAFEADGTNANGVASNGAANKGHVNYTVSEIPLGTPRQLRVITIGAGAAGLNMARHIELHMENVDHIIYEKNPEVGGTWYENK
jgi:hypothetical protein